MDGIMVVAGLVIVAAVIWYAAHNYKGFIDAKIDLAGLAKYQHYAAIVVDAVEQMAGTDDMTNEEKLEYAMDVLIDRYPEMNDQVARVMIEAAVKMMNESISTIFTTDDDDPGIGVF